MSNLLCIIYVVSFTKIVNSPLKCKLLIYLNKLEYEEFLYFFFQMYIKLNWHLNKFSSI